MGTLVRRLREARGWSLGMLADRAGMDTGQLSLLERERYRKPSARTVARLARALDVDVRQLMAAAGYVDPPAAASTDYATVLRQQLPIDVAEEAIGIIEVLLASHARLARWRDREDGRSINSQGGPPG
jgi:transcriptional regulator with XRE-family HTH domain